ncbi:hypothetical protein BDV95DRAFT_71554 [Massariosphaeria phaeospora]|uniref:Uncharacterized protein n=1 Tax=Massariosphaeria phaeospora TaxID=100035 RepID=A0A7C8M7N9_9PLEO|nr:hypothetical protein BDV95DRAFT_71554 [Massariosphaeria phaeospora]
MAFIGVGSFFLRDTFFFPCLAWFGFGLVWVAWVSAWLRPPPSFSGPVSFSLTSRRVLSLALYLFLLLVYYYHHSCQRRKRTRLGLRFFLFSFFRLIPRNFITSLSTINLFVHSFIQLCIYSFIKSFTASFLSVLWAGLADTVLDLHLRVTTVR